MASKGMRALLGGAVCLLALIVSNESAGQPARTVVWLDYGMPDRASAAREARTRALQLELDARNYTLLEGTASDPRQAPEQASSSLIERSGAAAVIWLEVDPERPVSWLFVRVQGQEDLAKSPLTHPPAAIDPQLLAIAAASLLDQTLREPSPAVVPPPAQAAAHAPAPPPPFAQTAKPVVVPLAEHEGPRVLFLQVGMLATFAGVSPDMESDALDSEPIDERGFVALPGLRFAIGGWVSSDFALSSVAQWYFSIDTESPAGNLVFGIDGLLFLTGARARGFGLSAVAGLWMGRTDTPVGTSDKVVTGPFGARLGLAWRYGLTPDFALIATPSFGLRFPTSQLELELGFAAEHPF
jgi:hypothetical protein